MEIRINIEEAASPGDLSAKEQQLINAAVEAAKNAYEMLDPRMVETQKAAVIFDPDVARAILGGILAAIDGSGVFKGPVFSEKV